MTSFVAGHLQVVRIIVLQIWVKVHKDGFFFSLTVKEKLDVFIKVTPYFRFSILLWALVASVYFRSQSVSMLLIFANACLRCWMLWLVVINRRQSFGFSTTELFWKLSCNFVQKELTASKFQVLLRHWSATFKTCINKRWGAWHDLLRVIYSHRCPKLLLNSALVVAIKWLNLCNFACVKKLIGHAGLCWNTHRALKLSASLTWLNKWGCWNDYLLWSIIVLSALTLVLSGLNLCFLICGIEIFNDVGIKFLYFLF